MAKKNSRTESLGTRMKEYEALSEKTIAPEDHMILRIDGHKFSRYTKGMEKPFDEIFSKAMELTTYDLVEEFTAYTGYTQSDEITLILPSLMTTDKHKGQNKPKWGHTSGGRTQKLASLVAGFTTMSFNRHFKDLVDEYLEYNAVTLNLRSDLVVPGHKEYGVYMFGKIGKAWFDCRVFGVPSDEEAFNAIMWRVRDAEKNSRSMFAQTYCSHKSLQNMTGLEQVEYCKNTTKMNWNEVDDRYKYGTIVKKEQFQKDVEILPGIKATIGEDIKTVTRSRIVSYSKKLEFSDNEVSTIMRKYL